MESLTISDLYIMLIEPSSIQARIIMKSLEAAGVNSPVIMQDGQSALEAMTREQPDLVISAMHLPDMTGTQLVQTMREHDELEDVPFMLISSETSEQYLEPIRQAGVIAILPKPFDPKDLRRALYSTLDYIVPQEDFLGDGELADIKTLVVDDSLTSRRHIKRILNNIGITNISEATNGQEGISLLQEDIFDLLVTDYNMPEMDGQELVRYVRESSSQQSIPIMMVTSETDESRLTAVRQSGVSAICDKPFESSSVKELLRQLLAGD
jgi:two-component system chemotaxis response regulator CheY